MEVYYHGLLDECGICEVCGISGALDDAYSEPYYGQDGKLYNEYPRKYRGGFGGHFQKIVHFRQNYSFNSQGLTLCCYCHSYVAEESSKKSIANTREEYATKIRDYFVYSAWAQVNKIGHDDVLYKSDKKSSGIMLFSHNHYPFVRGLVIAVPGSDDPATKDNLRSRSKYKYVIVEKVYPLDMIPKWAKQDTDYKKNNTINMDNIHYRHFIHKQDNGKSKSFNLYVEVVPYEMTEEKKVAAKIILVWMRRFVLPRVMARRRK